MGKQRFMGLRMIMDITIITTLIITIMGMVRQVSKSRG